MFWHQALLASRFSSLVSGVSQKSELIPAHVFFVLKLLVLPQWETEVDLENGSLPHLLPHGHINFHRSFCTHMRRLSKETTEVTAPLGGRFWLGIRDREHSETSGKVHSREKKNSTLDMAWARWKNNGVNKRQEIGYQEDWKTVERAGWGVVLRWSEEGRDAGTC